MNLEEIQASRGGFWPLIADRETWLLSSLSEMGVRSAGQVVVLREVQSAVAKGKSVSVLVSGSRVSFEVEEPADPWFPVVQVHRMKSPPPRGTAGMDHRMLATRDGELARWGWMIAPDHREAVLGDMMEVRRRLRIAGLRESQINLRHTYPDLAWCGCLRFGRWLISLAATELVKEWVKGVVGKP